MLDQQDNLLSSYNYDLPKDLIAQSPIKSRHDAKLMIGKDGLDDSLNLVHAKVWDCLLYTSPSPRDRTRSRMPSSA